MSLLAAHLNRWKAFAHDVAAAVAADEPLFCDDPTCDCNAALPRIDEACWAHN